MKHSFSGLGGQGVRSGPFEGDLAFMLFMSLFSLLPLFEMFLVFLCSILSPK